MTKNMGIADRVIRMIIALILGILAITVNISGTWGIIVGIFSINLLVTSAIGWCPLYKSLGISTKRKK